MGRIKRGLLVGVLVGGGVAIAAAGLYGAYRFGGVSLLLDAIIYLVLFSVTATVVPLLIVLKVPTMHGSLKKLFGRTHFVLGQVAYGVGFLVQTDTKWDLCRGRTVTPYTLEVDGDENTIRYEVKIDDAWHPVLGDENLSILGWRPFGVLRHKTDETLQEARVDQELRERAAEAQPNAAEIASADLAELVDGGDTVLKQPVERAGFHEVALTTADVPEDGWLVDLKQIYQRGIEKVGDIELIEKAEEITMRNDAKGGAMSSRPWVGGVIGLILGCIVGYIMLVGAG